MTERQQRKAQKSAFYSNLAIAIMTTGFFVPAVSVVTGMAPAEMTDRLNDVSAVAMFLYIGTIVVFTLIAYGVSSLQLRHYEMEI